MKTMEIEGKPLSAFRTEIELGMTIYCLPDSQLCARKFANGTYGIYSFKDRYQTFEAFIGDSYLSGFVNALTWSTFDTNQTLQQT
jgi:hypothetical protein